MHVEARGGRDRAPVVRVENLELEGERCSITVSRLSVPHWTDSSPGRSSPFREALEWTQLSCTRKSGIWFLRGAFRSVGLLESLENAGVWTERSTYRTAWAVCPGAGCSCSYAYGNCRSVGPYTGEWCWPLLTSMWRAAAPPSAPGC